MMRLFKKGKEELKVKKITLKSGSVTIFERSVNEEKTIVIALDHVFNEFLANEERVVKYLEDAQAEYMESETINIEIKTNKGIYKTEMTLYIENNQYYYPYNAIKDIISKGVYTDGSLLYPSKNIPSNGDEVFLENGEFYKKINSLEEAVDMIKENAISPKDEINKIIKFINNSYLIIEDEAD